MSTKANQKFPFLGYIFILKLSRADNCVSAQSNAHVKKRKFTSENKTINNKRPTWTNGHNVTKGPVRPETGRAKDDRIRERDAISAWN